MVDTKRIDEIKLEKYISLRLAGYSPAKTLLELKFSKSSSHNYRNLTLYKYGEIKLRRLLIEEGLDSESVVKRFKNILTMKIELEEKVLEEALNSENFKKKLLVLAKSKDNISDLAKLVRLLEGESTENVNLVSKEEYQYESNRLKFLQNAGNPSSPAKN